MPVFVDKGSFGSGGNTTANVASISFTTTVAVSPGELLVVVVAVDNRQAGGSGGGDDSAVASVSNSGTPFTWTKASQVANNLAAQAGASCSVWWAIATDTLPAGFTVTAAMNATTGTAWADAQCIMGRRFTAGDTRLARTDLTTVNVRNAAGAGGDLTATSSSFTPPDNSLLVMSVGIQGWGTAGTTTISGGGLTWTKQIGGSTVYNGGSAPAKYGREEIWTAPVTTGASMTVTITDTGATKDAAQQQNIQAVIVAYTNYNTSSPIGGKILDTTLGDAALTITLDATPATTSDVFATRWISDTGAFGTAATAGSGWTQTQSFSTLTSGYGNMHTQVRRGSTSTSVAWVDTAIGSSNVLYVRNAMALEIKENPSLSLYTIDMPETPAKLVNDTGADPGSLNLTTANEERLRIRAIAAQVGNTTALTPTSTWTAWDSPMSASGTTAEVSARAEHLISTATGAASDPTYVSAIYASTYVALRATAVAAPNPSGTLSVIEQNDSPAFTGVVATAELLTFQSVVNTGVYMASDPSVKKVGSTYYMSWTEFDPTYPPYYTTIICLSTSSNGTTWTPVSSSINPAGISGCVLKGVYTAAGWDQQVETSELVYISGTTWRMYYAGRPADQSTRPGLPPNYPIKIGLATSTDNALTFTKSGSNPVINNTTDWYDHDSCQSPTVVWDGVQWVMLYTGANYTGSDATYRLGVTVLAATSSDGVAWIKQPTPIYKPGDLPASWMVNGIAEVSLSQMSDGRWMIQFTGQGATGSERNLGYGVSWSPLGPYTFSQTKILSQGAGEEVHATSHLIEGGTVKTWYLSYLSAGPTYRIAYATGAESGFTLQAINTAKLSVVEPNDIIVGSGAAGSPPAFTAGSGTSTPNYTGSSTTFPGLATGVADANRYNIVGIGTYGSIPTGVTINGVTASKIDDHQISNNCSSLWYAANPSGTTGNVVVTYANGTVYSVACVVWRMVSSSAPTITSSEGDNFGDTVLPSLTVPSGGGAVFFGHASDGPDQNGGQYGFSGTSILDDYSPATGSTVAGGSRTVAGAVVATMGGGGSAYRTSAIGATFTVAAGSANAWTGVVQTPTAPAGPLSVTEQNDIADIDGVVASAGDVFGPLNVTEQNDIVGGTAAGSPPVFTAGSGNATPNYSGSSTTFPGLATGSADASRYNIVGVATYGSIPTGLTINGVAATKIDDHQISSNCSSLWYAANPSGTTGNVVITYANNTVYSVACVVWSMVTTVAPTITSVEGDNFGDTVLPSLTVPSGGGAVFFGHGSDGPDPNGGGQYGFTGTSVLDDYSPTTGSNAAGGSRTVAGSVVATMGGGGSAYRTSAIGAAFTSSGGAFQAFWTGTVTAGPPAGSLSVTEQNDLSDIQGAVANAAVNLVRVKDPVDHAWKTPSPRVKNGGVWATPLTAWVKNGGTWMKFFDPGTAPPGDTSAYYLAAGPFLTWSQESAMGGNFPTWQSHMSTYYYDNKRWDSLGMQANYGYGAALLSARYRGGGVSDWDTDAAAFIDDYIVDHSGDMPEPHYLVYDMYYSYLLGKANASSCLSYINGKAALVAGQMDSGSAGDTNFAYNHAATSYTCRRMFKMWDYAMVLRKVGNVSYNWVTRTQTFRDAFIANQNSNGGYPAQSSTYDPSRANKFFQTARLCGSAMFYYDQFEQNASVLNAIRNACIHAWRYIIQVDGTINSKIYKGSTFPYMERYTTQDPDDWRNGDVGQTLGTADIIAHWLDVFGWLAHKDGDTTWIARADILHAKWIATAYLGTSVWTQLKNYDEAYAPPSWRYSYWKTYAAMTTSKPYCTAVPTITGTPSGTNTLTANSGTWVGGGSSTWRWMRLQNTTTGGVEQIGTASTYTLVAGDNACFIWVEETRTNGSGAGVPAVSTWVGPIT